MLLNACKNVLAIGALVGYCGVMSDDVGAVVIANEVKFEKVMMEGDALDGMGVGESLNVMGLPAINNAGQVMVRGAVKGDGVSAANDYAVWMYQHGGMKMLLREDGGASYFGDDVKLSFVSEPVINDAGKMVYLAGYTGSGFDSQHDVGLVKGSEAGWGFVHREGNDIDGQQEGEKTLGAYSSISMNNAGEVLFQGTLKKPREFGGYDYRYGLWKSGADGLKAVAIGGGEAGGVSEGEVYKNFQDAYIGQTGMVVFEANITGSYASGSGVWTVDDGVSSLVMRKGMAYEGMTGDEVVKRLDICAMNNVNDLAILGKVTGTGVDDRNEDGIWVKRGSGGVELIAREGDVATGEGLVFNWLGDPRLFNDGNVVFTSGLSDAGEMYESSYGLWMGDENDLSLLVKTGDDAVGVTDATFVDFAFPIVNGQGDMLFLAGLSGNDITASNDVGLWMRDAGGALTKVLREGDVIDVSDVGEVADYRTVSDFYCYFSEEDRGAGRASSFNDAGECAIQVLFTDGSSGVFVASVPEPSALGVLMLGAVAMGLRRRVS